MITKVREDRNLTQNIYFGLNKVFAERNGSIFVLTNDGPELFYQSATNHGIVYADNNALVIGETDGLVFFRESINEPVFVEVDKIRQVKLVHSTGVIVRCGQRKSASVKNVSFAGQTLWQLDLTEPFVSSLPGNDRLIFHMLDSKVIRAFDLASGVELWSFDLRQVLDGQINIYPAYAVNYGDKIFVSANVDIQPGLTFCLNSMSGKETQRLENIAGCLRQFNGYLYAVRGTAGLVRTDMETLSTDYFDFANLLSPLDIAFKASEFQVDGRNRLFFVDALSRDINKIGVIDLENKSLLQTIDIGNADKAARTLINFKILSNQLFVQTSDNVLHVFNI